MRRYLPLLAFILYLALVTFALLSPDPFRALGNNPSTWRDFYRVYLEGVGHFLLFMPAGYLACLGDWRPRRWARLALLVSYSLASEGLQHFIPRRTASLWDALQDVAGLATGAALWGATHLVARKWRQRKVAPREYSMLRR